MEIELEINGVERTVEASKADSLLDVLRRNGYTGAKRGCDTGACGFCTVHVDGEPVKSCVEPVTKVQDASVETIEGLGEQDDLHPIQQAFVDNTALQCGFCIPGMIMRATALLEANPDPTEQEVREALSDNLCRCTGYKKIVEAVLDAADRTDSGTAVAADGGTAMDSDSETAPDTECSVSDCGPTEGDQ
ncbi:(2Fe-2S)-binding protein [Haloarcula sp. S1AR25-5A]|uniref:(2Fe-2S)-binding protein n=1 Tax=Haloarcula terrestris TaxID=2950533 RepID=A0AAE4JHM3_9EURY|nr:2Fe-2S iron-sulfur cluster-binding protein [Haloarcula terrestris]MDS0222798.1 (2Fe-2S)-binding protein [Haloarcula terrestris]